jgi:hypothetical protein
MTSSIKKKDILIILLQQGWQPYFNVMLTVLLQKMQCLDSGTALVRQHNNAIHDQ